MIKILADISFLLAEILLLTLKILYYICKEVYRLIVLTQKKSVIGEIVLITGAGHGIGKELAIGYASLGATVVCWDVNEQTNNETMNEIKKMGKDSVYAYRYVDAAIYKIRWNEETIQIDTTCTNICTDKRLLSVFSANPKCDVVNREEVFKVAEKVKKEVGDVTVLINNAGIWCIKSLLHQSTDEIARVIDVNVTSHYWTLKAFLPSMVEKNHGHVVALSSIAGLFSAPYGTVYCPSKFAVKAIMESVSEELRVLSNGKSAIKFTTIYPNIVHTGFVKNEKIRIPRLMGGLSPRKVASAIIDAQRRNYENKSIPSFFLPGSKLLRLLPDVAYKCAIDFGGFFVYPDYPED